MKGDWFWNLLFHPKYINYGNEKTVNTKLYLAIVPYEYPIAFSGKQEINTNITDYYSIQIHFKSDEMKAHDYFIPKNNNLTSNDTVYMRLNVYFDLDIYYLFPTHTRAYFEAYSKDLEGKEITIKRIEFSKYQKDAKNNKTVPYEKRSPFLVNEEEEDETDIYKTIDGISYTFLQWKKFEEEQYQIYMKKKSKRGFWNFFK